MCRVLSDVFLTYSLNSYSRHHYVESVHFSTSKGDPLHLAIAVIQTPHREYYILRDNGMQIGCEEDGIAPVWQEILGCNSVGILVDEVDETQ